MNGQVTGYQEKEEIKLLVQDTKHYRVIKRTIGLQKHHGLVITPQKQVLKGSWYSEKLEIMVKAVHMNGMTG